MSISAPEVLFWTCPVSKEHTAVAWEGAIARCETCGMTSTVTEELVNRARADQRRLDIEWLLFLARKFRAAADGDILAINPPLVPADILEKVSVLLANAPIGTERT